MTNMTIDRRTILKGAVAMSALATPAAALAASNAAALKTAIIGNHTAAVKRLQDWIALPSIAAENLNYPVGAESMAKLATEAGFQHAEIVPTSGKRGVFATLDAGAKKTLGLYFMYDVKQFDPEEWSSPPLEGRLADRPGLGKVMIGRGAVNQKGPEATFLATLHAFKTARIKLPVNLALIAEGEEEIASTHFRELVSKPQVSSALKRSVGVMVPSCSQGPDGVATIALGAKGVMEFELIVDAGKWGRGPKLDVHSSEKARVDSPAWRLVGALGTLVSPDGNKVMIDGIPEMVAPLTPRQKELITLSARETSEDAVKRILGVTRWIDDMTWEQSLVRLAQEPTVNIQGLICGHMGPGGKTILPHRAVAKMEVRLVPNMTKEDTIAKLRAHLDKRGYQDVQVNVTGGYDPTQTDENAGVIKAGYSVYERAGVKAIMYPRLAGSWPGVTFTGPPLNLPVISFGLGHGGGMHAPDEYYLVESTNPKILGMDEAASGFADFLYRIAAIG